MRSRGYFGLALIAGWMVFAMLLSAPTAHAQTYFTLAGTQWQECETYSQEVCGFWTFDSEREGRARWGGGVRAAISITINGRDVTVTRRDLTSPLQATYRGTLSPDGTQIIGQVYWCCDGYGNRSGTWRARIVGVRR